MKRLERSAALAVVTFLAGKVLVLVLNLFWFPTLRPVERTPDPVSLLIPMRDEARRLPHTLPGLAGATRGPVIFLDDRSSDGSGDLIRAWSAEHRVRVVDGQDRPPGWTGKTWACAQLAEATTDELLVFCDVDVLLAPGAVDAVAAEMRRQDADVFSVFCRQLTGTWAERLLTPLINDVVLCFLPFKLLSAPVPAAATASGALLAFRRSAYDRLGGFAAVREELVEDVALARLTRRHGLRLGLALGGDLAQVRMYTGWAEVIDGMGRGLVPAAGGRRGLVAAGWAWHVIAYTIPVLRARSRIWALALGLGILERMLVEAKTGGRDWLAAASVSMSPLAAAPVVARSMRRRHLWKGRRYG